jgi:hypothetical protein
VSSTSVFPSLVRSPCFGLLFWLGVLMLIEPSAEQMRGSVPLLAALHLGVLVLALGVALARQARANLARK